MRLLIGRISHTDRPPELLEAFVLWWEIKQPIYLFLEILKCGLLLDVGCSVILIGKRFE